MIDYGLIENSLSSDLEYRVLIYICKNLSIPKACDIQCIEYSEYSIHDAAVSALYRHNRHRLSRFIAVVIDRHSLIRNIINVIFHHDPYFGPSVDIFGPKVSCTATKGRGEATKA